MDHSDNAQCWCFPASNGSHHRSHGTNPDASVWNACAPATFCSCVNNVLNGFWVNPRLTKVFFVTRLTKGGGVVATPPLNFPNPTPYELGFGINGLVLISSNHTYLND